MMSETDTTENVRDFLEAGLDDGSCPAPPRTSFSKPRIRGMGRHGDKKERP